MKKVYFLFAITLFLLPVTSCKDGARGKNMLPGVTGKSGEIIIVMEKREQDSDFGKKLVEILTEEYEILPQVEPTFNPHPIPLSAFSDLFKHHRNIILVRVSDEYGQARMLKQQDVWASPQTIISIEGNNLDSMATYVEKHKDRLIATVEEAEIKRNIDNIKKYEDARLREAVEKQFGISLSFPRAYELRKTPSEDFMWISYETQIFSQGVFIYSYPYMGENLPPQSLILKQRADFLKRNIPGPTVGSYMIANPDIIPAYAVTKVNDMECAEVRGLWEVKGDFMGGPFISYTFYSKPNRRAVTVEAYVYVPQKPKRISLRQVDAILRTFAWTDGHGKEDPK
ncbi:MAG: DUF4837 family protein [Prevotellaceae bacterium]|jgi:hypothetical protein|nr:DUF4837 family protein [Prevotellaceae bacterium]